LPVQIRSFFLAGLVALSATMAAGQDQPPDGKASPEILVQRGTQFFKTGRVTQAILEFRRAISLEMRSTEADVFLIEARMSLANALLVDDDFEGAREQLDLAYQVVNGDYATLVRNSAGAKPSTRSAKLRNADIFAVRSAVYYGLGKYTLAIQACEKSIDLVSKNTYSRIRCGDSYRELGNYPRALQYFNVAVQSKPEQDSAWAGRGRTYLRMRDFDNAKIDCNKAVELNSDSKDGVLCLAELSKAQGDLPAAIQAFNRLLALDSFSRPAREGLVQLTQNPILKDYRVALVIGNGDYKFGHLDGAPKDAADMALALRKLGFAVIEELDLPLAEMRAAFDRFVHRAKDADVALVYYSGHGGEYKNINYLVPIQSDLLESDWGFYQYLNLQESVDILKTVARTRILIVDACRTEGSFKKLDKDWGPGVVPLKPAAGMYIAYASQPNNFSYDGGRGNNSPFTGPLLKNLTVQGLELRDLLLRVREDMERSAANHQLPQALDDMRNRFIFYPPDAQLIDVQ
jgi:tetratricopeptide (TPR) repeat protein